MRLRTTCSVLAATAATSIALAPAASATAAPPGIPSTDTAISQLAALPVETEGSMTGYDRDEFNHWITVDGCDTRETVLARDGDDVEVGSDCRPTSGDWYSEYDGESFTDGSDLDIDHVVPLAEAWRSGADSWSAQEREDFANDLDVRSSSRSRPRPTGRRGTRTRRRGGRPARPTRAPTRRCGSRRSTAGAQPCSPRRRRR